jgi:PPOX class probable F420-dependent enzyme
MTDLDEVRRIGGAERGLCVVATTRPDGSVHGSVVNAGVLDHPVSGQSVVGIVVQRGARKLDHFRRSGRACVVFRSGWQWVAVEGPVEVVGPDDQLNGFDPDRLPGLLRDVFRGAGGVHEDWGEYDRVMAAEGRAAVLVSPARITSNG